MTIDTNSIDIDSDLREPRFVLEAGQASRVAHLIEPVLNDLGFRLVRVKITATGGNTLQIMAERPDGFINIEECEAISEAVSPVLDLEDPITAEYRLEISSPGIDRPLVRASDLRRAMGHEARVEMAIVVGNRKRFRGLIQAVEPDVLVLEKLETKEGDEPLVRLNLADIAEGRLVLTDALVRTSLKSGKTAEKKQKELKREARKAHAQEKRKPAAKPQSTNLATNLEPQD